MTRTCENCINDFEPDSADQVLCPACIMQPQNLYSPKTKLLIEGCDECVDAYRPPLHIKKGRIVDNDFRSHSGFTKDKIAPPTFLANRHNRLPQRFKFRKCKICGGDFYPAGPVDYKCPDCKPTKKEKRIMENNRRIMRKEFDDCNLSLSMETCIKIKETSKKYRMSPEKLVNYALDELDKSYLVAPGVDAGGLVGLESL